MVDLLERKWFRVVANVFFMFVACFANIVVWAREYDKPETMEIAFIFTIIAFLLYIPIFLMYDFDEEESFSRMITSCILYGITLLSGVLLAFVNLFDDVSNNPREGSVAYGMYLAFFVMIILTPIAFELFRLLNEHAFYFYPFIPFAIYLAGTVIFSIFGMISPLRGFYQKGMPWLLLVAGVVAFFAICGLMKILPFRVTGIEGDYYRPSEHETKQVTKGRKHAHFAPPSSK